MRHSIMGSPSGKNRSGKFVLRVSPELHEKLRLAAEARGASLNHLCVELLEGGLTGSFLQGNDTDFQTAIDSSMNQIISETKALSHQLNLSLLGVVLFGSFARGRQYQGSDIDLLLVLDKGIALSRELYSSWDQAIVSQRAKQLGVVSPHFVHIPEQLGDAGGIWLEIALEGIVLSDKDFIVSRFLADLRAYILENNIRSKVTHGHRYWIKHKEAA